jgi:nitrate reductase gamma subunit
MFDIVLFVAFPYLAVVTAVWVGIYRYRNDRFSYSTQSSQFLENRMLSWGSAPWHYAILIILSAHFIAVIIPSVWASLISAPIRLYVLEVTGLALALVAIFALGLLVVRRLTTSRVRSVTTPADWLLLALLLVQVVLGFWVALFFRWGADWYLHTAVPWIVSLVKLQPEVATVTTLPWVVKLHILGGFLLIAVFPFTRLVHAVIWPITYLWRPYQVVVWNRERARAASEGTHGT